MSKEIVVENANALAFVGDAVFSLAIRKYLVSRGYHNTHVLQEQSKHYVSAQAQATVLKQLLQESFFDENDLAIISRGKNFKSKTIAKNTDMYTYQLATALETIMGYYELYNHQDKQQKLLDEIIKIRG